MPKRALAVCARCSAQEHARTAHGMGLCNLCVEHGHRFLLESRLYTPQVRRAAALPRQPCLCWPAFAAGASSRRGVAARNLSSLRALWPVCGEADSSVTLASASCHRHTRTGAAGARAGEPPALQVLPRQLLRKRRALPPRETPDTRAGAPVRRSALPAAAAAASCHPLLLFGSVHSGAARAAVRCLASDGVRAPLRLCVWAPQMQRDHHYCHVCRRVEGEYVYFADVHKLVVRRAAPYSGEKGGSSGLQRGVGKEPVHRAAMLVVRGAPSICRPLASPSSVWLPSEAALPVSLLQGSRETGNCQPQDASGKTRPERLQGRAAGAAAGTSPAAAQPRRPVSCGARFPSQEHLRSCHYLCEAPECQDCLTAFATAEELVLHAHRRAKPSPHATPNPKP